MPEEKKYYNPDAHRKNPLWQIFSIFLSLGVLSLILVGGAKVVDISGHAEWCFPDGLNNFSDGTCVTEARFIVGTIWYVVMVLFVFIGIPFILVSNGGNK